MSSIAKKTLLENGFAVVSERFTNANVVSLHLGVKLGSVDETDAESGLCHFIEHMVFKGSRSYRAGEIATLVESRGGEINAYTSLDQTVYYINIPSRHFVQAMQILKEMVFDAVFDPEELEREKEVVLEEIRRSHDSPQRVLGQTLFESFYEKHNYRRPVIGTEELVKGFSRETVLQFYKKHYQPQNMILGVCGNVTEEEVMCQVRELFLDQIPVPVNKSGLPLEPHKTQHNKVFRKMNINATYFDLAFPAQHIAHPDVPALDVLSYLLGESETSLLEQITLEKLKLVHNIYSSCFTPKHPGLFMIGGLVEPKKLNAALASILEQIEFVKNHLFEDEKIERAKLTARSQLIYEKQTCEGTARKWTTYETTVGDYNFDKKYMAQIEKITSSDIREAARKYLDAGRSTLVVLHPEKLKLSAALPSGHNHRRLQKMRRHHLAKKEGAFLYRLDNGIRVVLKENHRLPLVAMKAVFLGGLRVETAQTNGISHLLSNILVKSTQNHNQLSLSEKCEWLAASLSSFAGHNSIGLSFSFLSDKLLSALPLFSEVLTQPAFNPQEIASEIKTQLEAIKNRTDHPAQTAFHTVMKKLFTGHPYQYHLMGEASSVKKINQHVLKNFYLKLVRPRQTVICAVGSFDSEIMLDHLNRECLLQPAGKPPRKDRQRNPTLPPALKRVFTHIQKKQAHLVFGFLGPSLFDEDRFALEIIVNILSGQGGRLFLELRDKHSLAYSVTANMVEGLDTGFFGTYIGTEPGKVKAAFDGMMDQLRKIRENAVSEVELDRAKNYIVGNYEIDHQKNSAIATQLVLNELYGMGLDEFFDYPQKIMRVTRDNILKAAQKYIALDRFVLGVVGPRGCWKGL